MIEGRKKRIAFKYEILYTLFRKILKVSPQFFKLGKEVNFHKNVNSFVLSLKPVAAKSAAPKATLLIAFVVAVLFVS